MQYNISDSQALFWCFVLIILRMARHFVLTFSKPDFVLSLFLIFWGQNQDFYSHKIALIKKQCIYIMTKKTVFRVLQFYSTCSLIREKTISLCTPKECIYLYKLLHNQKQIKKHFHRAIYDGSEWLKALHHCHKETYFWYGKVPESVFGFYELKKMINMSYIKVEKKYLPQNIVLKTLQKNKYITLIFHEAKTLFNSP